MAATSFYDLAATLGTGAELSFSSLKGKKVLIVNTASDCGYTPQYKGLQELHEKYKEKLFIIGFPSNDFGEQEKGTDDVIEQFCQVNYGVSFPLVKKSAVIKGAEQHTVYQWLTDENKNGWNYAAPNWNFCKYLIDENGNLTHFFQSGVEPGSAELETAIAESSL
ncbi:MAG: glutathione peroxidase [Ferruginibacter sp.]